MFTVGFSVELYSNLLIPYADYMTNYMVEVAVVDGYIVSKLKLIC